MIALQSFINNLSVFLDNQISTSSPEVGASRPNVEADVPAVTLSMTKLTCTTVGVGGNPSNWETETTRCSGVLQVDIFGSGKTKTEALSNDVAIALSQKPQDIMGGLTKLSPVTWGAVERPATPIGNAMVRTLCYSFMFDHEQPVLSTGGGPIRVIDVRSEMGPEHFLIKKEE